MHTRFILINPSHAGNVGAVARAMKVMGFDDLVLVQPRWADVLTRPEALERASGADDVLRRARIVTNWDEAVEGIEHLCATAMTARDFGPPTLAPRAHFTVLAQRAQKGYQAQQIPPAAALQARFAQGVDKKSDLHANESTDISTHMLMEVLPAVQDVQPSDNPPVLSANAEPVLRSVGLVFGCERYGMSNEDVYRCHVCLRIPTHPDYGSLNLAAAAQVLAYEWRMALGSFDREDGVSLAMRQPAPTLADAAAINGMLQHWQQALQHIGYLDPASPKKLLPRLRQMFYRTHLRSEEIHILRGIARQILRGTVLTTPVQRTDQSEPPNA